MTTVKTQINFTLRRLSIWLGVCLVLSTIGWLLIESKNIEYAAIGSILFLVPTAIWIISIALIILVAVHEAGHLLAGLLVGFHFEEIQIGRLQWKKSSSRTRYAETEGSWLNGHVRMFVPANRGQRWRYVCYVLGGTLLVLLALLTGFALIAPSVTPEQADRGSVSMLGIIILVITISPLVPYRNGAEASDGLILQSLFKNWSSFDRFLAVARISKANRNLEPVENWSETDLELATSDPTDEENYTAGVTYRYYQSLMLGNLEGAREWLNIGMHSAKPTSGWFYITRANAAIFFGYVERDANRSDDALSTLMPEIFPGSYIYPMAVAATRLAQGRLDEARLSAEEAKRLMDDPNTVDTAYPTEREMLDKILGETNSLSPESTLSTG